MGSGDGRSLRSTVPRPAAMKTERGPLKPPPPTRAPSPVKREPVRSVAEPTVLVIGAEETFLPALRVALGRHQVYVETALAANAVETVVVTAPDLVLLVGEAARDAGREVLAQLGASPVSSIVPVAILGDETALDARLRAFRHGAAAVIPRSASADAIAEQIARLAREIPERGGAAAGVVGEATLAEFVETLGKELRSGILSVQQRDGDPPVRLVLGSGRPLAEFIDEFVRRVRRHVMVAEPLEYEFDDRASGTVQLLANETLEAGPPPGNIEGLRVVLADDNSARADVVAQELRARGATVVVSNLAPDVTQFARLRQLDPQALVIGEAELEGAGYDLLKRLKGDTRLRWASLLVVRWNEIWENALAVPTTDRLAGALASLSESDRGLYDRSALGDAFDARLELIGPARCLRALCQTPRPLRLSIHNARMLVNVDLSDGLVVGASATSPDGKVWEGAAALAAFLVLGSGRLRIEPVQQPATTNLMTPVDVALDHAESESAPIAPSIPAPPEDAGAARTNGTLLARSAIPAKSALDGAAGAVSSEAPRRETQSGMLGAIGRAKKRGVSRRLVALLMALAVVQGLVIAVILVRLTRPASLPPAAEVPSKAPANDAAAPPMPKVVPSAGAPLPREQTGGPAGVPSAPAPPPASTHPTVDESGTVAPTCEALLDAAPREGAFPGAALEQSLLARKAIVQGRVDEAQRAYCKAVRWDANNPNLYFDLAQLLLLRRDGAACAEWAKRGLALDATNTRGHSLLGDGLARVGDTEGARRAWLSASNVADPSPAAVRNLTQSSLEEAERALGRRDFARAERFFRRAAVLDPESASAPIGLTTALLRLRDAAAARWAERAVERGSGDPRAHFVLGDALLAAGDRAGAKSAYTRAGELGHPDAARRLRRVE